MKSSDRIRRSGHLKALQTVGERSKPPVEAAKTAKLKILVVDDDDASRMVLMSEIARLGHDCRAAADGVQALEMHSAERADVILSDWKMPRMNGAELCRRVRATVEDGAYTYFIFMTSFGDRDHFVRGMQAGADDYQTKPVDLDELGARLGSAARVIALYRRLEEKNSVLRKDSQHSFVQARVDSLTCIGNRLRMTEDLDALWARAKRYGHRYCAALCDIDWFKEYNDNVGHIAGDDVLRRIAQAMRDELRSSDGLYRYGGEEFLAILPEQPLHEALLVMDRVRTAIERLAIPTVTKRGIVTISVGIAELRHAEDASVDAWLARADRALYVAKAAGRDRIEAAWDVAPPGARHAPS